MTRAYSGSLERWFSIALMNALHRAQWSIVRRAWGSESQWQSPDGRLAWWTDLRDSAILIAALVPNPKGLSA